MPVSGLVVVLADEADLRAAAVRAMELDRSIELGPVHGNRLALIVETPSGQEDRRVWDMLHHLAGVRLVEVVFVGWDHAKEPPRPGNAGTERQPFRQPSTSSTPS